jgi:methanogenic corrinoid protein MtbC1
MSTLELENVFGSISSILEHIENANSDILMMMESSARTIVTELHNCNKESFSDELNEAIQLQDIISQQVQAVTGAIGDMQKNLQIYLHSVRTDNSILNQGMTKLHHKMDAALVEAKRKHDAFLGRVNRSDLDDGIEFF